MKSTKLMLLSAATLALSAIMLGVAFSAAPAASAGRDFPCNTVLQETGFSGLGFQTVIATDTPIPTCTPVKIKTHTPTMTPTEAATQTPVPATPAPTQPAATATKPGGGAEGQGVRPPDTGSGPGAGGGLDVTLLFAGIALAALGGGAMLVLAAKRR